MALPAAPILFNKPRTTIAGPYPAVTPIPKCAQDGTSDYEAELCFVMKKSGRNIPAVRALDYVLGYTCSNDVSARSLQMATSQWSYSKGLDGSCPIGKPEPGGKIAFKLTEALRSCPCHYRCYPGSAMSRHQSNS